jgi:hypothetical protein
MAWTACLLCLLAVGCGKTENPSPVPDPGDGPDDPLVVIDDVTITFGDIEPALRWFDSLSRTDSKRAKMRRILEEYLVPQKFAERDFAALRELQLAQASALCEISGNVVELEENSRQMQFVRKEVTQRDVEISVAMFLFDESRIGAASAPIPVPQGFIVAGAFDLTHHQLVLLDRVDALQVPFHTHTVETFAKWREELPQRLADKATFFHPGYRDAMPTWLELQ